MQHMTFKELSYSTNVQGTIIFTFLPEMCALKRCMISFSVLYSNVNEVSGLNSPLVILIVCHSSMVGFLENTHYIPLSTYSIGREPILVILNL